MDILEMNGYKSKPARMKFNFKGIVSFFSKNGKNGNGIEVLVHSHTLM